MVVGVQTIQKPLISEATLYCHNMTTHNNRPRLSFSSIIYAIAVTTWFIDANWNQIDIKNHPLQFCWDLAMYAIPWIAGMEFIESAMPSPIDVVFPIALGISAGKMICDLFKQIKLCSFLFTLYFSQSFF